MKAESINTAVVIPNWNGEALLGDCIDSLLAQARPVTIVVVDNGSVDKSLDILASYDEKIVLLKEGRNLGFAGGVNVGIRYALANNYAFVALLNNDAIAERDWSKELEASLHENPKVGIATSKIVIENSGELDSTGDWYTTTGMPFPRGRNEIDQGQYDKLVRVFGASGGASLYRAAMLKDIGLFDEDFFAYYEDVDLSFRAQLAGWQVIYNPGAVVYHKLSATSSKHGYFAIHQSAKNFWFLYLKNLPSRLFWKYLPAALYRYGRMFAARVIKGGFWAFLTGWLNSLRKLPKKLIERHKIQSNRKVPVEYIERMLYEGRPPVVVDGKIQENTWDEYYKKNRGDN